MQQRQPGANFHCDGSVPSTLEAISSKVETITSKTGAFSSKVETITSKVEAFSFKTETSPPKTEVISSKTEIVAIAVTASLSPIEGGGVMAPEFKFRC